MYTYTTTTTNDFTTGLDTIVSELIHKVSSVIGVSVQAIYSNSRITRVKFARWLVWHFLITKHDYSLSGAGKALASWNYDHSSVCYAMKQLQHDIKHDHMVGIAYQEIEKNYKSHKPR